MTWFSQLTGQDFGKLRDDMQQGFKGGSFSEGGKAAIKAFDPLISKERLANELSEGVGGNTLFSGKTMDDQAGAANTVGQLYSLYALGNGMFGGESSGTSGMGSSSGGMMGNMGGMMGNMGGGQQQQSNNSQSMQLQQQTSDYMERKRQEEETKRREEEQAQRLAEILRNQNGY